jgi:hypothetical protein
MNKTLCRHCFENGRGEQRYCSERRAYDAQIAFNRRMRGLLAAEPNLLTVPDPPDYSDHFATGPLGVAGHYAGTGWPTWTRSVYSLLAQDGATYRRLRVALDRATVSSIEPATTPARRQSRKAA